jgi:hypothetical protein
MLGLSTCNFFNLNTLYSELCKSDKFDIDSIEQCKLSKPQNLSHFLLFYEASNIGYFDMKLCMFVEDNIAYI